MEVGTPVTNKFYLGQPAGEICGLDLGGNRFTVDSITKLRADTDIPGLYLTGESGLLRVVFSSGSLVTPDTR